MNRRIRGRGKLRLTVSTELDPLDERLVRLALDALGDRGLGEEGDDGHSGVASATRVEC
jgi:hypothetical protein